MVVIVVVNDQGRGVEERILFPQGERHAGSAAGDVLGARIVRVTPAIMNQALCKMSSGSKIPGQVIVIVIVIAIR